MGRGKCVVKRRAKENGMTARSYSPRDRLFHEPTEPLDSDSSGINARLAIALRDWNERRSKIGCAKPRNCHVMHVDQAYGRRYASGGRVAA